MMRALLCELEGVLFDTATLRRGAMARAIASVGGTLPDEWRANVTEPPIVPADAAAAAAAAGLDADALATDLLGVTASRFFLEAVSLAGVALTDGAESFVSDAAARVRLGVVTRARRSEADVLLSRSPFADAFSFVVAEEDTLHGKPHAGPYRAALDRLHFGPRGASAALALEHGAVGIAAAVAAGIKCVAVGPFEQTPGVSPAAAFPSLTTVSLAVLARFAESSHPGVVV